MTRTVHLAVLRRWRLEGLGLRAGIGAVAGSLGGTALGADSMLHLGAIVLGGAIVAAWPLRSDERRALRWVGERVGLAYETAWEHARLAPAGDPRAAALRSAVEVQGRLSVRDLQPPTPAAWWLPLATVALGLWLWSSWGATPADGAPGAPPAGPPPSTTTAPFVPEDARIEDSMVDDPAALEPPDDSDAARDGERSGSAPSGASGAEAGGGAAAERDVLERFLDRLRERPPEPEDAARTGEAAGMGQEDDQESGDLPPLDDDLRSGAPGDEGDPTFERPLDGEGAEGETTEQGEGDGEGRSGESAEGDEGEDGAAGDEGEEGEGADEPGSDPREQAPGSGDPLGVDEGSDDASAGIGVSAPGQAGAPGESAMGDPEPLPSLLGPGAELPIGGIQLPGAGPDGAFPTGPAGTVFRRGVEEALNEGDLPVAYQEVIRNYFR
jgi:hypothetical protein